MEETLAFRYDSRIGFDGKKKKYSKSRTILLVYFVSLFALKVHVRLFGHAMSWMGSLFAKTLDKNNIICRFSVGFLFRWYLGLFTADC